MAREGVIDDAALSGTEPALTTAATADTAAAPAALGGDAFTVVLASLIDEVEADALQLVRLAAALPLEPEAFLAFEAGFDAGVGEGFANGWNAIIGTVNWLQEAGFSIIAAALDDGFGTGLGDRFADDIRAGRDVPEDVLAFVDSRYPALADIARGCATFARLVDSLEAFARSAAEQGMFVTLFRVGVKLGPLIAAAAHEEFHKLVDQFVSLQGKPDEQGRMIGRPFGRVGFEIVLQVALGEVGAAVKGSFSAVAISAEVATTAEAGLAAVDAARAGEILGEAAVPAVRVAGAELPLDAERIVDAAATVAPTIRKRFSILEWRGAWTLETAAAEAYLDAAKANARYGSLKRRTGIFNAFSRAAATLGGWSSDSVIRLDAHHIIESRMFVLRSDPRFAESFAKLRWASKLDMPATALEMEFHIRTGSSLAKQFKLAETETYIVNSRSLSYILEQHIGDPSRFKSFEELLNAYEGFYRAPVVGKGPTGAVVRLQPLWPRVEETFVQIRATLGLPPPP